MISIPRRPKWLSVLTLVYGIALFIWLNPEENSVWTVSLYGMALAALLGCHAIYRFVGREVSRLVWRLILVGLGTAVGGGAALATVALMFLKTSIHAHVFPDYPPLLMLGILARLPAWTLAGALVGLVGALNWPGRSGD